MQSWTESWLTDSCGPLGHTLIVIATEGEAPVLRCTRCARREVLGGGTCLVCNNPGESTFTLYRTVSTAPVATGKLCSTCERELMAGPPVAGWYAVPEGEPARPEECSEQRAG